MSVPGLSLLGPKAIRGFVSILRSINPTIIIIIKTEVIRLETVNINTLQHFNCPKVVPHASHFCISGFHKCQSKTDFEPIQ